MKIGVIGNRGSWSTESLSQKLAARGADGQVVQLDELVVDLGTGVARFGDVDVSEFDGLIIKKMGKTYSSNLLDELELLEQLERGGARLFSSPANIRRMISRLSCTLRLRENTIPMPPTFITESKAAALDWIEAQAPVILKPLYSTKARGMVMLTDRAQAEAHLDALQHRGERIMYLQKHYHLSGADYGLVFLGGAYIGAYARVGDGSSWHNTTDEGGRYKPFEPDAELLDLATRAQQPFDLDFTCVDIAITDEMGPVVFEVSAFGSYKGLIESAGIDAPALLADYVIAKLNAG